MTTLPIPLYQVDSFTAVPFAGNPAGVCLLPAPAEPGWMQKVAAEMNLSETAFLVRQADGFDLRWFTPAAEVDLCGHATLASAHILWQAGLLGPAEQARFHTRSGLLTCTRKDDWIEMDFPANPPTPVAPPEALAQALGVPVKSVHSSRFDYLVEVDSEATVRAMQPDFGLLRKFPGRGVMVTALAETSGFDFVSRFFAPAVGVNEDPVTGSAHCCLTPFWAGRLGKDSMTAYQASARGGVVKVHLLGERVLLSGQAVTVFKAELQANPL